jgi:hypothetical protein
MRVEILEPQPKLVGEQEGNRSCTGVACQPGKRLVYCQFHALQYGTASLPVPRLALE